MTSDSRAGLAEAMIGRLGAAAVMVDKAAIGRFLKDSSWLSPILSEHFNFRGGGEGGDAGAVTADMVVTPQSVDELRDITALAVRFRCPITVRGGGTTNFAQSIPLEGGVVIDSRRLDRVLDLSDGEVTCEAGALQGNVETAARARGQEFPILVTTYASATVAGWIGGGHVGLGGAMYGTLWDDNVRGVRLLTAEDPPRELVLRGSEVTPVLRTSGATGIITDATFRLVPARRWLEAVASFDSFEAACRYIDDLTASGVPLRAGAAQEPPIPTSFGPVARLYPASASAVLMIVDTACEAACAKLAAARGGTFRPWQVMGEGNRVPIAYMSYGHRMLWVKRILPTAGFLNCYMTPGAYWPQFQALKTEFGDSVVLEHKYINSAWLRRLRGIAGDAPVPAPLVSVVPGSRPQIEKVMRFCDGIGVGYQNPHTFSVAESGLFPDMAPILAFARKVDPHGLLNPGKLHGSFFKQ